MDYLITRLGELLCHTWHKDECSEMESRTSNGIVICDGSEFSFFTGDTEVKVDAGHILVLPQGAKYNFRCRKTGITYTYNFFGKVPFNIPYSIETDDVAKCLSHARELLNASDIYTKIGLMYRIIGDATTTHPFANIPDIIKPQLEYMRNNYGNADITNSYLASLTNISEIYFRKLFVKHLGISPHEYIGNIRIEFAKKMLAEGKSVSQTADECGFANVYYFSSAFKKKTGISPSGFAGINGRI